VWMVSYPGFIQNKLCDLFLRVSCCRARPRADGKLEDPEGTEDFFNILYWLEEKEGKLRTTENTTDNSFGSAVDYQFLVALFCRPDFFDRKLSLTLDSSCCAD